MKLIRACVVVGTASLLIGVPAASAAPKLTIKPAKREILFGKTTKITGHLSGTPNSGQRIRLESNPYPYNGFQPVSRKNTDSNGNYSFTQLTGGGNYSVRGTDSRYTFNGGPYVFNQISFRHASTSLLDKRLYARKTSVGQKSKSLAVYSSFGN